MSISVTTDVFCDACPAWTHGAVGQRIRREDARRVAKRAGWKRVKSQDLCPECLKALQEATARP